ncbi:MAG: LysE family translocator [Halieaceae bacterium]
MNIEILTGLALFALVSSITPGPNNLMLMASGANFGFRRTLPHMLGVALGFVIMVILVGVGLVQIFDTWPASYTALKVASVAYLVYLAARIATAAAPEAAESTGSPFTFTQAALFQWVNPKAWTMALSSVAIYAPSQNLEAVALVAVVFGAVNLPSVSMWAALGQRLRSVLHNTERLRAFNFLMAGLLVASLYPILL